MHLTHGTNNASFYATLIRRQIYSARARMFATSHLLLEQMQPGNFLKDKYYSR